MTMDSDQRALPSPGDVAITGPLQYPAFRWFFFGTIVSLLGSAMAPVALAFAVLDLSAHASDLGWVLAARSTPLVMFLLVGGVIADRFLRSTVLKLSNVGAAITQGTVAFLLLSGAYELKSIIILEFLNGTLTAFAQPAMRGIVPQLVQKAHIRRANSLLGSAKNVIAILGPTVAGIIVVTIGGGWAVAADAASFLVAAFCMARLGRQQGTCRVARTVLADVREGWREFRSMTWVWAVVASLCVTNCLRTGIWSVLGPMIANQTMGAASWGVVLSARACGLLVMSVVMYRVVVKRLLRIGQLSLALGGIPLLALGLHMNVYGLAVAAFLAGIGSGVFGPAWETSLHEHVPNNVLSRVASYDDLFSYVAVPIGMIAAGPVAAVFGAAHVATIGGFLFVTATLLPLLSSSVRRLRHG